MAVYAVFESVNMGSTHYAERVFDAVAETDIENGTFGYLDGLATGETNVYNFKAGTKNGETVVVVDQPAWTEDTSRITNQRKDKFIIQAGTKFRVRVVKKNDEFGITAEGITAATRGNLDTGVFLTIDSTTGKLVAAVASAVTNESSPVMEAEVMRKRTIGGTLSTAAHTYGYAKVMYEAKITVLA